MATTAFQPTTNHSKYFLQPHGGPTPPDTYFYSNSASASSPTMAQDPTKSNNQTRISPGESYGSEARQLKTRLQPSYLPAALRPTEPPPDHKIPDIRLPDTPPASQGSSFGSINPYLQQARAAAQSADGLGGDPNQGRVEGGDRPFHNWLTDDPEPEVLGPPITAHWQADAFHSNCAICKTPFTWWWRRHHCRHCGEIVCENHLTHKVKLDHNARLHTKGKEVKACPRCYEQWQVYSKIRASRANSIAETGSNPTPDIAIPQHRQRQNAAEEQNAGNISRSFYMNWSTF